MLGRQLLHSSAFSYNSPAQPHCEVYYSLDVPLCGPAFILPSYTQVSDQQTREQSHWLSK